MTAARRFDLLGFGETMVRLSAPRGVRLEDAGSLDLTIGGTESNVAVALARLGRRTAWVSALPDNPLGRRVAGELHLRGVDTSLVTWDGDGRVGVYFLDPGIDPRPTRVYYDRAGSSLATIAVDAVDPSIVEQTTALHLTGITPALSESCAAICRSLAETAVARDIPLVFDVNYRARLWSPDTARTTIEPFLAQATLVFCGLGDARQVLGLDGEPAEVATALLRRSNAATVVLTLGADGALALQQGGDAVFQPAAAISSIVDPVGAGDAFAAGYIDRWLVEPRDLRGALRSAVTMAALKMTVAGDHASVSRAELDEGVAAMEHGSIDIVR